MQSYKMMIEFLSFDLKEIDTVIKFPVNCTIFYAIRNVIFEVFEGYVEYMYILTIYIRFDLLVIKHGSVSCHKVFENLVILLDLPNHFVSDYLGEGTKVKSSRLHPRFSNVQIV